MKTIEKYFIAVLILSFQITVFGQFNTLTPTLPKKRNLKSNRASKRNRQSKLKKKKIVEGFF
jgi:hypothetical protein